MELLNRRASSAACQIDEAAVRSGQQEERGASAGGEGSQGAAPPLQLAATPLLLRLSEAANMPSHYLFLLARWLPWTMP